MTTTRVCVIGCGFGGLEAVRALARSEAVEVILIDRTNHHLFQPLLYQVATADVAAPAVAGPIRHILRRETRTGRLTILRAEVTTIDAAQKTLQLDDGSLLGYDALIVAAGATHSYFGNDHWAAFAPGLKTLTDAFAIRSRIIGAFEQAERTSSDVERSACLNFVIIGGGPTGVELAGALAEIARHTLPDEFRRIDSRQARIVLMEGGPRVLGAFDERLSESAAKQLRKLGVELHTGCQVTGIDAEGVDYREGGEQKRLPARTVLWAAGVAASPLGKALAASAGATLDRAGRVSVQPDLSLAGHPEIQVIGDLAAATSPTKQGPKPVPGVSPAAKQMGKLAAANILRRLRGEPTRPFKYADYGSLSTLGRNAAVVQLEAPVVGRVRFSGYPAWLFWLFAHIYFLIGFRNRLVVLIDWAWSYWTFARHARVVAQPDKPKAPATPSPS
ncbi:NAD(P)/FAD-dependent oxidoreductase [Aquincola sp. S2]|uniref:NADH:ubiquinone reductase (non-electrogenic) n=1 Tax=Pseudaquabacterium terrae TaxID=2732868 RepID=A0ABX2EGW0_9BURK|nr:NAD(P)/FAD-dependent oxidoreductase [Aquabacterium terrae]NRF67862.1 NAD(P)/FAD-dependent oxidoreductase [Aquabacterium terrae]